MPSLCALCGGKEPALGDYVLKLQQCVKRYNFAAGRNQRIGNYGYLIKTAKNIRRV
jgi:hypothetical protein